jgi:hypothetical protein
MSFEEWLTEEIGNAEREAKESHKTSMNSYGAGYDRGYVAALQLVLDRMTPADAKVEVH